MVHLFTPTPFNTVGRVKNSISRVIGLKMEAKSFSDFLIGNKYFLLMHSRSPRIGSFYCIYIRRVLLLYAMPGLKSTFPKVTARVYLYLRELTSFFILNHRRAFALDIRQRYFSSGFITFKVRLECPDRRFSNSFFFFLSISFYS